MSNFRHWAINSLRNLKSKKSNNLNFSPFMPTNIPPDLPIVGKINQTFIFLLKFLSVLSLNSSFFSLL
jgi:hypothetical protein